MEFHDNTTNNLDRFLEIREFNYILNGVADVMNNVC